MSKEKLNIALLTLILVVLTFGVLTVLKSSDSSLAGTRAPRDANQVASVLGEACDTTTVTSVTVGHEESIQVLATSTDRALTRLQVTDEENVYTVSFLGGALATVGNGVELRASTTDAIDFGIKTAFPYIGPVHVITSAATTSILVTQCLYN